MTDVTSGRRRSARVWIILKVHGRAFLAKSECSCEKGVSNAGLGYDVLDVGDPPARFSRSYMLDHHFWLTW